MATSGELTHWLRDQFARDLPAAEAFAMLAAQAEAVRPRRTTIDYVYDMGTRGAQARRHPPMPKYGAER